MDTQNIQDMYPLSPMQQGMIFHTRYAPETAVYFEQSSWTIQGAIDLGAFERAWRAVLERHPALRTSFYWEGLDEPLQIVHRHVQLPIEILDWRDVPDSEQKAELEALMGRDRERGFDLTKAPLMRLVLARTGDSSYVFVWSHHHLLLDGWSMPLILQEVMALYGAYQSGQNIHLEPSRPYRDYIAWLQQQDLGAAEAYWRTTLEGFEAPTPLAVDHGGFGEATQDESYRMASYQVSQATTQALSALAQQHHLTLNTIVQGAWALRLARYCGEKDVVFGATVSGRPADLPGSETMVGMFINTLPVRIKTPPQASVLSWLQQLQAQQAEAHSYEYSPLAQVQKWSQVPPDQPLFESIIVFENYPVAPEQSENQLAIKLEPGPAFTRTNYPLTLGVTPGRAIGLEFAYDCALFDAGTIDRMAGHLATILEGFVADPNQTLSQVPLLTEAEKQLLLVEWNKTDTAFPDDTCAHRLFEEQAERTPDTTALRYEGQSLSYHELNARANQLAHALRDEGIGPETFVAICTEPSFEMIIGVLAVQKAGGAYVPLDPSYPADRLEFVLKDCGARLLLTQHNLLERLPQETPRTICLDSDWPQIAEQSDLNSQIAQTAQNLAYVIYTSGSTGRPKGTLLEHRSLCNLASAYVRDFNMGPSTRLALFFSFGFDGSVGDIFSTLISGGTLCLAPRETVMSMPDLHRFIQQEECTQSGMVPSALAALPNVDVPHLQTLVSGGERLTREIASRWLPGRQVVNAYGPTEATLVSVRHIVTAIEDQAGDMPIGRAIANTQLYVLDDQLQPVPIGVPGELYIAGAGLARGYLNRPELTNERFINSPFDSRPGARIYKTGDLVRYRPNGILDFLGRVDDQVKVRGFRIELGEIESVLRQHPQVDNAVLLVRADTPGEKYLTAYIVRLGDEVPDPTALRRHLLETLPTYMVPAFYVTLDSFPLSPAGKIDRRALPAPEGMRPAIAADYVAPRTPVEFGLADIWGQVLNVARIGVHDDFFELGGHSLLATQLASRIREVFQIELPLRDIFESHTIATLATHIEKALRGAAGLDVTPIQPIPRDAPPPLSYAQQRLWFLDQLAPGNLFYNLPLAIRLEGELDVDALRYALNNIIARHEPLRTTLGIIDDQPVQIIAPELSVDLPVETRDQFDASELVAEARQPFDLEQGPLFRARLIKLTEDEHIVLLTMHHIISDGWSLGILVREVAELYAAHVADRPSRLQGLVIQYADFCFWQRQWLQGETLQDLLAYWQGELVGSPPILELPTDHPRPAIQSHEGNTYDLALSPELSKALQALSQDENVTLFMTLLAGFQVLLFRYSGQEDICVGTPIANRNRAEIENLIGFFVNTLVMRGDLSGTPSFRELLERTRERALGAYAHQDLPFEMLVEAMAPQRDLSHTPLFQVMFALNNTPSNKLALPGLSLSALPIDSHTATFDLTLQMNETDAGLAGSLEYNSTLFEPDTIARMMDHFARILEEIVADPEQSVAQLAMLTPDEHQQMVVEWNGLPVAYPSDTCVHHLFEAHAQQAPEHIALTLKDESWTYQQLNHRANQLAHYLHRLGVGQEQIVGVSTLRGPDMLVAILGILKAGGAYLPLDPTYPHERLAFMLEDSQISVLITQRGLVDGLPTHQAQTICLDSDWEQIAQESTENPPPLSQADNLAYVIYTSGSTGRPKGAMLCHRGLCNLTQVQRRAFSITPDSRVLQFSPFSFDASVWETFMALANGATLCLAPQEVLASGPDLVRLIREVGVTHATLPPSVLRVLPEEPLPSLQTIISAGEACTADLVARWAPGRAFFNAYGPTETTVCASFFRCDPQDPLAPPIGRPIDNCQLYVLDPHMQPVPMGVPGELHIGGVNVARGYYNRPDLTAQKFVPDPFSSDPQARLYKTGDLVRYGSDGNISFLGRIDHQVKIRGFRIELGEVESVLRQHEGIKECVALAREDTPGDKRLVAYLVAAENPVPTAGELRAYLRGRLPEYLVPSAFVMLEAFPLTPSDKIDRNALPAPDTSRPDLAKAYVAPRTEVEAKLAAMCAELLGIERVGVYDSFFDLGGHSLLATQFISRVRQVFGVEIALRVLFETPTIANLAQEIEKVKASGAQPQAPEMVALPRDAYRRKRSAIADEQPLSTSQPSKDVGE